ncbi:MAG: TMEM175 family protein [Cytophagaceae bacterium]|nr:TMEM175 family protein [Cytophagaceae bacterium]
MALIGFRLRNQYAQTPSTARIETFSDGVMSIIVTLLVLNLNVPKLPEDPTNRQVWLQLLTLLPSFIGFAFSFLFVAIFWVNHHQLFHSLNKATIKLLWINNLLLFWICFVPFPTSFVGNYPTQPVAVAFFNIIFFLASANFSWMRHYVAQAGLYNDDIPEDEQWQAFRRSLLAPLMYLIAMSTAFLSIWISLGIDLLTALLYFAPITTLNVKQIRALRRAEKEIAREKQKTREASADDRGD